MADSNGYSNPRLDRLEASHVKLMTDHAVFVAEHEKFVAEQEEHWRRYQIQREEDRQRGIALDKRIAELVSGIGEFIRRQQD